MNIEQWHGQLPDQYRDLAIANTPERCRKLIVDGPIIALNRGFYAALTPEGWDFWQAVEAYIRSKGTAPLPKIPEPGERIDGANWLRKRRLQLGPIPMYCHPAPARFIVVRRK